MTASLRPTASGPLGALVGRLDLDDRAIRAAVAARLVAEGRANFDPDIVLEAARLGKRKAIAFLRKLVLPQPAAPLAMPVQPILRAHHTDPAFPASPSPHS